MKFVVNGGRRLEGEIKVGGSKNAATPVLAATLLTERPCVIKNLPLIGDVLTIVDILKGLGSKIEWVEEHSIRITNDEIDPSKLDMDLVSKIRSSTLLMGPILARFGEMKTNTPGGCRIGVRPLDTHINAFRDLGFEIDYDKKKDLYDIKKGKKGDVKEVILAEFSVTASENMLMFAAIHPGIKFHIMALEPHVVDLGKFLEKLGVKFEGLGSHDIAVTKGIEDGGEVEYRILNDPIEAGTFMVLAAATKSDITIKNAPVKTLTLPLLKLKEFGVEYKIDGDDVTIFGTRSNLRAIRKLEVRPYPGFPSDLQAPFGVLATQANGETLIFDTLYEGRLKYLYELEKMGAMVEILGPHRAIVKGPTPLQGKNVESIDLRAGATLIIAALVAEGESTLHTAEQIDRGYEKIEERLIKLGADIKRIE